MVSEAVMFIVIHTWYSPRWFRLGERLGDSIQRIMGLVSNSFAANTRKNVIHRKRLNG